MLNILDIIGLNSDAAAKKAETLADDDIPALIAFLSDKDDKIRYPSFVILAARSKIKPDVYPFFGLFLEKLRSENSYQRSIGAMLLAANARWDEKKQLEPAIGEYFKLFSDPKPITMRQSVQALSEIVPYKKELRPEIAARLMNIDIASIRPTMQKLVLQDVLSILLLIRKEMPNADIDRHIAGALSGGLLDEKAKAQIQRLMSS